MAGKQIKGWICVALACGVLLRNAGAATVFPIATNPAATNLAGLVATCGSNYLAVCTSNTIAGFVQFVSTNGSLIGPPVSLAVFVSSPQVAFANSNYLVAWFTPITEMGYGQLYTAGGAKFGAQFELALNAIPLALASNGTNFLAVMATSTGVIQGQMVTPAGTLSGLSFAISSQQGNGNYAAAAFGATNFLVVWQSNNGSQSNSYKTYGALISPAGSVGSPFQISQTVSLDQHTLAVAFDGTNYLAAWSLDTQRDSNAAPLWNLYGRLVSPSGTLPGNELVFSTNQALSPALAFDGLNYLLGWSYNQSTTNTNKNVFFQFLNRAGGTVGSEFTAFQPLGTNMPIIGGLTFDGVRFEATATIGSVAVSTNGVVTNFTSGAVYGALIPASSAIPTLTPGNRNGSQFSLHVAGAPGVNYTFLVNTNLSTTNWTPFATNSSTNGTFNITDAQATNGTRFYRAFIGP